ncbi:MAG TPA: GNAT family N-acetyltransferase [Labilithrix sp.]|nr:GNAT family N-acetyltransferase [Labilithrix sp.]
MSRFDTRVISTERDLASVDAAWQALRTSLPAPRLEHQRGWLEGEARTKEGMMVVTLGDQGEVRAMAPFLLKKWKLQCRLGYKSVVAFPMLMARLCGDALLAPDGDMALQESLMEAVAKSTVPYQTIFIESLPLESSLRKLIDTSPVIQKHFWPYFPAPPAKHWSIKLPKTFAEYNSSLGSEQRRQFRQREKKLTAATNAPIKVQRVMGADDVASYIREVSAVSKLSWQGRKLGQQIDIDSPAAKRIEEFAKKGWLRGYLLRTTSPKSEVLAFVVGFQSDGVYYYDTIGYDPQWSSFSPGNLVLYKLIEDLYAHDPVSAVDLGGGDNLYKRIFGNDSYDEQNVFLFRRSPYTRAARATHAAFTHVSTATRVALQRTGLLERARQFLRRGGAGKGSAPSPPAETPVQKKEAEVQSS